jgi:hypothetical protein
LQLELLNALFEPRLWLLPLQVKEAKTAYEELHLLSDLDAEEVDVGAPASPKKQRISKWT